jgi:hypothetical protein
LGEVFAMAERGDAAIGVKGIAVPLMALDGERHVAHVLPLTSGAPPGRHQLRGRLPCSCRRRRWTRLQVGGAVEVAETLGVAASTVKTHLHRLFAKTGAKRQADLVKLVAGYAGPFVR